MEEISESNILCASLGYFGIGAFTRSVLSTNYVSQTPQYYRYNSFLKNEVFGKKNK